jgi:hypothetical protein
MCLPRGQLYTTSCFLPSHLLAGDVGALYVCVFLCRLLSVD